MLFGTESVVIIGISSIAFPTNTTSYWVSMIGSLVDDAITLTLEKDASTTIDRLKVSVIVISDSATSISFHELYVISR